MYFPYFRGRQFEIIALRELLEMDLLNDRIIPIIEPVKLSSTLTKTMSKFIEKEKQLAVVHNPKVGSFNLEIAKESPLKEIFDSHLLSDWIIKSHIINKQSVGEISKLVELGIEREEILTIISDRDRLDYFEDTFGEKNGLYNLIPYERVFKKYVKNNKVLFDDKFVKLARNAEYKDKDEFFSEDHLFYDEEGYSGFSDFSVVGSDYTEAGFAPFAVAIHIVYFDSEKNLRIIHFVSDSNEDIQDPAGKFYEAVSKLFEWKKENDINTYGLNEFIKHYRNETYPGLGTVKKLSIMHHIELMSQYLDGEHSL
ncbi:hypothetical protein SD71_18910 [Cohnella kolymensis]|uniref:Sce7725 family protein n=1 Tax=Cohnella kolymensis TaxID=1590652 RepID=A0ABR5A0E8_9BACL|nr:sce7725 family protein [Cohnella kolymensis]KIL34547.1 hypothetical protein SD71_18910 [Cohnella kolymensis]